MRKANDSQFVFNEGVLLGINLGADFTSEHEWGIKGIKGLFGISSGEKDWGVLRRRITKVPDAPVFGWTTGYEGKGEGFYLIQGWRDTKPDFSKNHELRSWKNTLSCAWDEGSFGVFSTSPEEIAHLRTIYEAFLVADGVVFLGGGGVFKNSGLVLAIASRVPQDLLDKWHAADKDHYDLNQEVEATGIRELLKEKGKRYLALSPRRKEDGSFHFWLNPYEQQENNFGWYTLEALQEWAENKGPIPKKNKDRR